MYRFLIQEISEVDEDSYMRVFNHTAEIIHSKANRLEVIKANRDFMLVEEGEEDIAENRILEGLIQTLTVPLSSDKQRVWIYDNDYLIGAQIIAPMYLKESARAPAGNYANTTIAAYSPNLEGSKRWLNNYEYRTDRINFLKDCGYIGGVQVVYKESSLSAGTSIMKWKEQAGFVGMESGQNRINELFSVFEKFHVPLEERWNPHIAYYLKTVYAN